MNDAADITSPDTLKSPTHKRGIDKLFLSLIVFLGLINTPLFLNLVLPVHDTMYFFQCFYYFYNELMVNGEIAHWAPYGYYGVQGDFFFLALTPTRYLVGFIGYIFNVHNVYLLFKSALFLEQLVLLYGTYKLCGLLFKRKSVIAFVCIATAGSTALLAQATFNFSAYYFMPLIMYLLVRFFSTYKPQYALGAMLAGIASLVGGAPYIAVILLFKMVIVCPILFIGNLNALKSAKLPSARDLIASVVIAVMLVSLTLAYGYFVSHTLDENVILSGGRDPLTGATDLRTFLTYGGDVNWKKFEGLWSPEYRIKLGAMTATAYDTSIYFGFIPFALFIYGLFVKKNYSNPVYLSLLVLSAGLALLSVGYLTPLGRWLYEWFPLMKYYRHVGYIIADFKFALPVLAGFGLEHLLRRGESESGARKLFRELAVVCVFAISVMFLSDTLRLLFAEPQIKSAVNIFIALAAATVAIMALMKLKFNLRSHLAIVVLVLCLFEVASYQYMLQKRFVYLGQRMMPLRTGALSVSKPTFQSQRTMSFPHRRAQDAFTIVLGTTPYAFGYNFMQWDPCMPRIRADHLNENVASLIRLWGDPLNYMQLNLPARPQLFSAVGCSEPKLRLASNVTLGSSDQEAASLLKASSDTKAIFLSGVAEEDRDKWTKSSAPASPAGKVEVTGFRANGLDLIADIPNGPLWLYYADAWHSGWKATVNGEPRTIAKANVGFKAVLLPEGRSTVKLFFDPGRSRQAGLVMIIAGILLMAFIFGSAIRSLCACASDKDDTGAKTP